MRLKARLLLALVLFLAPTGCSDEPQLPAPRARPSAEATAPPLRDDAGGWVVPLGRRLLDEEAGYSIAYPTGWWTTTVRASPALRYFDSEPLSDGAVVAEEMPRVAVHLEVMPEPFETTVRGVDDPLVVKRQSVSVRGRRAIALERQSAGGSRLAVGSRSYAYYVDLGDGHTLKAATYQLTGLDYERNKLVLDAMVTSVRFERDW